MVASSNHRSLVACGVPLQGQAEHYLEKLHHKVEKDLAKFLRHSKTAAEEEAGGSGAAAGDGAGSSAAGAGSSKEHATWNAFRCGWAGGAAAGRMPACCSDPPGSHMRCHPPMPPILTTPTSAPTD